MHPREAAVPVCPFGIRLPRKGSRRGLSREDRSPDGRLCLQTLPCPMCARQKAEPPHDTVFPMDHCIAAVSPNSGFYACMRVKTHGPTGSSRCAREEGRPLPLCKVATLARHSFGEGRGPSYSAPAWRCRSVGKSTNPKEGRYLMTLRHTRARLANGCWSEDSGKEPARRPLFLGADG